MAGYSGTVLTKKGRALQAKAQIGAALQFTRVKLGSGELPQGTNMEDMTALITPVMSLGVQDMAVIGDGTSRVRVIISNENLETGFFVREVGLFAQDPQDGEILYSISNAGTQADFLPAMGGPVVIEQVLDIVTVVGNAQNVTANIDGSLVLATKEDIETHGHKGGSDGANIHAADVINALLPGIAATNVQDSLMAILQRGRPVGRNMLITGPKDSSGNLAALYSDMTNGNITVKAGTKLSFADGIDENGLPKDYLVSVLADITKMLPAADAQTIPLAYTDDLCNGGTAISGGDLGSYPASNAFNNDTSTGWASSQTTANQNGLSYIGYNFGTAKAIRRIRMSLYSTAANTISVLKVQYSPNGSAWTDVITVYPPIALAGQVLNMDVPSVGAYPYWRLLAAGTIVSGSAWIVPEIEMQEALQTCYIHATRAADGSVTYGYTKQKPKSGKPSQSIITSIGAYTTDLCSGGTAISGGYWSGTTLPAYAFDNDDGSVWQSSQQNVNQLGAAYIGYNFGSTRTIRRVRMKQSTNCVTSALVQYSENGTDWVTAATVSGLSAGVMLMELPVTGAYQYWRVLANSNLANGAAWQVHKLEMFDYVEPVTTVATNDIIYTDNVAVGGSPISGGDLYPKENAFDGTPVAWTSSQVAVNQLGVAYIGYNFGVSRLIRKLTVLQGPAGHSQNIASVKVQRSTDGTTWGDVGTYALVANLNTIILPATTAAPFWRVLANSNATPTGYGWDVYEVTMHEICTDLTHYDPIEGVSRHYDGTTWTNVVRVFLGEAVVDSAGKIVSVTTYPYGLSNVQALPAVGADDAVTLGQITASLLANGWVKVPVMFNGEKIDFILQWGNAAVPTSNTAFPLPISFPHMGLVGFVGGYGGTPVASVAAACVSVSKTTVYLQATYASGTYGCSYLVIGY